MCLSDRQGQQNGAWYIIDTTAKSAVPFINVASAYKSFIILTAGEDVTVPSGYTAFTYKFNKNSVTAYHKYEDDTILVVYAMSPDGEPGWFYYDTVEKHLPDLSLQQFQQKQSRLLLRQMPTMALSLISTRTRLSLYVSS